ncbi:hypothetical protein ACFXGA_33985 [Actinosynnema sp. NPDC059335]|uniref:hypothetical protein n=1 Tax=Actinosynnema sp. NPDC059335 TaxID=3346804 RepID=UPI00366B4EE0
MPVKKAVYAALGFAAIALLSVMAPSTATAETPEFGVQAEWEVTIPNADGRLETFWVHDTNRSLYHRWQRTDGTWTGGQSLGGTLLYDRIAAARNADGRLEVFGIGTDKAMFHIWQSPSGGWSGWATLGGGFNGPPTVSLTSYGGIVVRAPGLDNRYYYRYQTAPNCCWSSGWTSA